MSIIEVTIKTIRGDAAPVKIDAKATIFQLKEEAAKSINIPANEQKLIFSGKITVDDKTLESYGL
jgi:hypothetical protein